jgi:glycosyltransferase involved in cell wall biosynthesis
MLDPSFDIPDVTGDNETFDLLYVGSLIKEKGVEYLVRALAELSSDIRLSVVGSGNRSGHLRSLAGDIGVKDRIEFAGAVSYEAVRHHYATADCFVHPGVWPEPFGRTILEAMQAGLPVVATDIGGPAEAVPKADLRCPPRDPTALADAITTARNSPTAGESNCQYVRENFAPNTVVDRIHDVYNRAIDG